MSDDRGKAKPTGTPGAAAVPDELKPFLRKREWPKTQKLGDDPALDAAAAAYRARDSELGVAEAPPVQDLARGMGNASAHVGPVEVSPGRVPATPADADAPKVELRMADIPRALPEGSRTAETVETRVLRLDPGEAKGTTIGGTERLPVLKVSDGAPAPVALPAADAPGSAANAVRAHRKHIALGGALVVVALLVVFRAATTRTDPSGEAPRASSIASAVAASPPATVTSAATPAAAPSAAPVIANDAAPPDASQASSAAQPVAPAAPSTAKPIPPKLPASDDPYGDAAAPPSPVATAQPTPPPAPPAALPSAAPAPKPTSTPDPDGEIYHRRKSKSP